MSQIQDNYEGFVVQKDQDIKVSELVEELDKGKVKVAETLMVPEVDWFRRFTRDHIVSQAEKLKLVVSKGDSKKWDLRNGDKITLNSDKKVIAVNNIPSAKVVSTRPKIVGVDAIKPQYANRRLPVEEYGSKTLKAFTYLAPMGKGQRLFVVAPPKAGKTWVVRDIWEACLKMMEEDKKLYVIGLHVGERAEDGTALELIRDKTPHDRNRSELYQTPDGDPEEAHYFVTQYVVDRARRLCESGYDVVLIIDSFSRVLMSHSRADKIIKPSSAGMIAGGVSTASITAIKRLLAVAGDFGDRSLTIVATMLGVEKGAGGYKRSSETSLYDETGPSTSTANWALVNIPSLKFPKIDVSQTHTREYHRICSEKELTDMKFVREAMWKEGARAEDALNTLLELADGSRL